MMLRIQCLRQCLARSVHKIPGMQIHHRQVRSTPAKLRIASHKRIKVREKNSNTGVGDKIEQFHPPHPTVLRVLTQIEDSMRLHGYSTIRIGLALIVVTGIGVFIFREYIRDKAADEVSIVAYKSLGDENVKIRAGELANALLKAILRDTNTRSHAVRFFQDVFSTEETKNALAGLLINVLNDPSTRPKLVALLKNVVIKAMEDPEFRANFSSNLKLLLQDTETKEGVLEVVKFTLSNDTVTEESKRFLRDLIASVRVKEAAVNLGKEVVRGVVKDASVQKQAGDAMWGAVGYSVTPRIFQRSSNNDNKDKKAPDTDDKSNTQKADENITEAVASDDSKHTTLSSDGSKDTTLSDCDAGSHSEGTDAASPTEDVPAKDADNVTIQDSPGHNVIHSSGKQKEDNINKSS